MNALSNVFWDYDFCTRHLEDLQKVIDSRYGPGVHRHTLRELRDTLHQSCVSMERSGEAEDSEEAYYCLFDALAHVTEALRGNSIRIAFLVEAVESLRRLRLIVAEVEV